MLSKLSDIRRSASLLNRKRKAWQAQLPMRAAMPLFRHRIAKPAHIKRVLFVHTSGGTGDALYVLGMVRRLAAHGVEASICTLSKHVPLLTRSGLFQHVFDLGSSGSLPGSFDAAVDLEYVNANHWQLRTAVLKHVRCWRITTGPVMKDMPLYDEFIDYSTFRHVSMRFGLVCSRLLDENVVTRIMPFVPVDAAAEDEADSFLKTLTGYRNIVYLNARAGDEDRFFSKTQTLAMLRVLSKMPETAVVVFPPDNDFADYCFAPNIVPLPNMSFPAFGSFVRRCTWVVTTDTSATHVAAAFDRPCLTFFPPNDRDYFIQYGAWEAWGSLSTISETVHPDDAALAIDRFGRANLPTLDAAAIPVETLTTAIRHFARRLGFDLSDPTQ